MANKRYYRPLVQTDMARPEGAVSLAGGASWFSHAEVLHRGKAGAIVPASEIPADWLAQLSAPREPMCGLSFEQPRLMGVLNVTPDSFSDGGRYDQIDAAVMRARQMVDWGADILDIGGESTRPGADFVDAPLEISRTVPLIETLRAQGVTTPISIDTRKAIVARAALDAGASLVNDVSALSYDEGMLEVLVSTGAPVCLMHASGDPKTMQDNPSYDDVLLDVYDYLEGRVRLCEAAGVARSRILLDPGIGFGKTLAHNLALIRGLSLFHGLGCPILLGVSRKGFIGAISGEKQAEKRLPGSLAIALEGVRQGVQMLRVHDIEETKQAVALWRAVN